MAARRKGPKRTIGDETVVIEGLVPLQRALRVMEGSADKHLKKRLRAAAEPVKTAAAGNVTNKTGRHGNDGPSLASSLKIGVGANSVTLYSSALHSIVQDQGGKVGRGKQTLLQRASVSQYMTKALKSEAGKVSENIGRVLEDLERDFEN